MIGHCGLDCLKKTATIHGLRLKRELKVCEDRAVAKVRQKNETGKKGVKYLMKELI
jgi:hypothetical protein